jgi:hypothetical protein
MTENVGKLIASRVYSSAVNQRAKIQVELFAPLESPHRQDESMCSFRIISPESEEVKTAFGLDEFQALQLALRSIHVRLRILNDTTGLQLRWIGDEHGDLGMLI